MSQKNGEPLILSDQPLNSQMNSNILIWDFLMNHDDIQPTNTVGVKYVKYGIKSNDTIAYAYN